MTDHAPTLPDASAARDWPRGCVQIYTGDGKGKSTAAMGLAARALGAGLRVFVGQFLKGRPTAEQTAFSALDPRGARITFRQFGSGEWLRKDRDDTKEHTLAQAGLAAIRAALESGYDLVVADEILGAMHGGVVTEAEILALLAVRPAGVELVLTGRNAPPALIEQADLVSETRPIKHYMDAGLPARTGIEY